MSACEREKSRCCPESEVRHCPTKVRSWNNGQAKHGSSDESGVHKAASGKEYQLYQCPIRAESSVSGKASVELLTVAKGVGKVEDSTNQKEDTEPDPTDIPEDVRLSFRQSS